VTIADAESHESLESIQVVKAPHGIAVSHDDRYVMVCNNGADVISVIGVAERRVVAEIRGPQGPNYVRISPDGRWAFVVHKSGVVSIINPDTLAIEKSLSVGQVPERVVFTKDGRLAFVNNTRSQEVSVIDVTKLELVGRVGVEEGGSHQGMAFSPDGARLYVVNHGAGSVSVVDVAKPRLLKRISVGQGPSNIITTC
jgi:YVTN family beta-propeller protein